MKFVLLVEESGYQIRYWNEMSQEIGPVIASSWDRNELRTKLVSRNINIEKNVFNEAIQKVDQDAPFIVLKAEEPNNSIDLFLKDVFVIDKE